MRDRPHSFFCRWEKSMPIRLGSRRNLRRKGNAPCTKVQPTNVRRNVVPWFVEKGIGSKHYNQQKWIPLPRSRIKETINLPVTILPAHWVFAFPHSLYQLNCVREAANRDHLAVLIGRTNYDLFVIRYHLRMIGRSHLYASVALKL